MTLFLIGERYGANRVYLLSGPVVNTLTMKLVLWSQKAESAFGIRRIIDGLKRTKKDMVVQLPFG